MMAPTETISAKKESHSSKRMQTVRKSVALLPETDFKVSMGESSAMRAIQGPRAVLTKKRGIVKHVSVTVPRESVEVPCKFEKAVIAECREAGMTADEIQKWIQEL